MRMNMRERLMEKESAAATVVGFVLILAILAAAAVLFFAAGAPAKESYAAESAVLSAKDAMISFSLLTDSLQKNPGITVSYLPVFESDAAVSLHPAGRISIGEHTIPLSKLSFGTGQSEIGLCAGGLIRSDSGNAVWLSFPKAAADHGDVIFVIPLYQGGFSRGASSAGVPVSAEYLREVTYTATLPEDEEEAVYLSYTGEDVQLWKAAFYELSLRHPAAVSLPQIAGNTVYSELLRDGIRSVEILCPEYVIA